MGEISNGRASPWTCRGCGTASSRERRLPGARRPRARHPGWCGRPAPTMAAPSDHRRQTEPRSTRRPSGLRKALPRGVPGPSGRSLRTGPGRLCSGQRVVSPDQAHRRALGEAAPCLAALPSSFTCSLGPALHTLTSRRCRNHLFCLCHARPPHLPLQPSAWPLHVLVRDRDREGKGRLCGTAEGAAGGSGS